MVDEVLEFALGDCLAGRYEIRRPLGRGGMGVVYEAFDRTRGARVALKTMRRLGPRDLYRFKNEFRALADVVHPNLVTLYELDVDHDHLFFTMELVEGTDFLGHVTVGARSEGGLACDEARLRSALVQLVDGVSALHASGKLHRDLKPSNVLVTAEGRVVLLDFGLVSSLGLEGGEAFDPGLVGTPEYMSPEQGAGSGLSEASDWYSLGVILYEALTGALPFVGPPMRILLEKQREPARSPRALVAGVPPDLDALCTSLLERSPSRRPSSSELRRLLSTAPSPLSPARPSRSVLVGRAPHLAELSRSFETALAGGCSVIHVRGRSGMGKSLLVQRFLDGLAEQQPDTVVLAARCYERESVPYKALDGIVDALSVHLQRLPPAEVEVVLPLEIRALTRLFPVLKGIDAVAAALSRRRDVADPQELRRRAASALREVLTRIAMRRPLVLFIDDLQWADADSAGLVEELLRPPDPPPLLLVASYRSEDVGSVFVAALRRAQEKGAIETREIEVGTLDPSDARELARTLLGDTPEREAQAVAIAAESRGSPFFVDVLAQHADTRRGLAGPSAAPPRLEEILHEQVRALSEDARRLLEVVAIAATPLSRAVAGLAAELAGEHEATALAQLRAARLVRSSQVRDEYRLVTYHDRVRESVVARLDAPSRTKIHLALAEALVSTGSADHEALVVHFDEGGEPTKAAEAAAVAAEKAAETLAFDRAAALFERALRHPALTPEAEQELRLALAEALTNDGRDADAAEVRLRMASHASALEALELRRRAAEQFLVSGHFDRGYALLRSVLADVGERFPVSPLSVLFWVLVTRLRLVLRGLGFREAAPESLDRAAMVRIDSLGAAGAGFAMTDNMRGAFFQTKNLLLSLDAGDPRRIARALSLEVCFTSAGGARTRARTFALLDAARAIARRVDTPEAKALADLAAGYASYMNGEWDDAKTAFVAAEEGFRDKCIDVNWLLSSTRTMLYRTLVLRGELGELAVRLPPVLRTAAIRGDEYATANFRAIPLTMLHLAEDQPDSAAENLRRLEEELPHGVFHIQHYYALLSALELDLYVGEARRGLDRLRRVTSALRRSLLLRVETVRVLQLDLHARCAIGAAAATRGSPSADLVARAANDAREISRVGSPWTLALAPVLRAGVSAVRGDRVGAVAELAHAEEALTATHMFLRAAAVRRRRGQLLGGDEGRRLVTEAEDALGRLGVRNVEAMTRLYTAGVELLVERG
ncbi:MAG: protein kinase [Myxococcales bacterium]|nr:protein kinase [Myxococcales bacterium]